MRIVVACGTESGTTGSVSSPTTPSANPRSACGRFVAAELARASGAGAINRTPLAVWKLASEVPNVRSASATLMVAFTNRPLGLADTSVAPIRPR